jgi:mercuric ion transport protein
MRERSALNRVRASTPTGLLGFAAALSLLASACCVLPLLLVSLGLSAARLVPVRSFTAYWPLLIVGAIVTLVLARRRMACECNSTGVHSLMFWSIATWTGVVSLAPVMAPLFY